MKHILSYPTGLILCMMAAMLVFFAGKPANTTKEETKSEQYVFPAKILAKTYSLDTITNAANDTIVLPWTFQSRYTGALQITRTNISGTTNLAVSIQASVTSSSGTDATWVTVATTSATTATAELLTLAETYGQRYRIIIDGTGTQSSSYRLSWLSKLHNG